MEWLVLFAVRRPICPSELVHLGNPLEGDLAGATGSGAAVLLVHSVDSAYQLGIPRFVEQVRLVGLLRCQTRKRNANPQGFQLWHPLPDVLKHMQQNARVLRFRETPLLRPGAPLAS